MFRAKLEMCDTECAAYLESFVSQKDSFLLAPDGSIVLPDSSCEVYADSLDSGDCIAITTQPPQPLSPVSYSPGALAGGIVAGVVAGILIGVVVTAVIAHLHRRSSAKDQKKQRKAQERFMRDDNDSPYEPISVRGRRVGSSFMGTTSEHSLASGLPISKSTTFTTVPEDVQLDDFNLSGGDNFTNTASTSKSNRSIPRKPKPKHHARETEAEDKRQHFSTSLPLPRSARGSKQDASDDLGIPPGVFHPQLPPVSKTAFLPPTASRGNTTQQHVGSRSHPLLETRKPPKKKVKVDKSAEEGFDLDVHEDDTRLIFM